MKKVLSLAAFALSLIALGGCATSSTDDTGTMGYENPDPLQQQVKMQEQMSRVTRTLTPF